MTTTPQPPAGKGRGAWTRFGGLLPDSGSSYYRLAKNGEQAVGSAWVTGEDHGDSARAVNRGVAVIQRLSGLTGAAVDGWFGPQTDKAVRAAQASAKVTSDGIVGRVTMRALLLPLLTDQAMRKAVQLKYLGGIVVAESELDPGAVGYDTPDDKGLVQINLPAHPEFTYEQAFDHTVTIPWVANELRTMHDAYVSISKADPWLVAILWHNNPTNAVKLAKTGEYPTDQAKRYVQSVLAAW
jgi:hypothetical protein